MTEEDILSSCRFSRTLVRILGRKQHKPLAKGSRGRIHFKNFRDHGISRTAKMLPPPPTPPCPHCQRHLLLGPPPQDEAQLVPLFLH